MNYTAENPEISIIMGVYNQYNKEQLNEAVNSILNQTFENFEFIIYDDGSDELPARYIERLRERDDRIRVIRCEDNQGLAFSLNRCIGEARGKYLARMDADDISLPNRLQVEHDFLEEHREYDWVGCNAKVFDGGDIWGTYIMAEQPNQYNFLPFSPYIHPTVMFRRELFEENEGYNISNETLRCEDYELFMRLYRQGYKGFNLQKTMFLYREGIHAYRKRTWKSRINEAKIRIQNFPHMELPVRKQILYILRPLVTALIPYPFIAMYKKYRLEQLSRERKDAVTDIHDYFQDYVRKYITAEQ